MTRLLFLPDGPDEAPEIVEPGVAGPVRRKLLPSEQAGGSAVLVLPGAEAVTRWLDLPAGSAAQARAAAAFQVGDAVAGSPEGLHLAVGERDAEGRALVVWIDREKLRSGLEAAQARGVAVTGALPDYLLLPDDAEGRTVLAAFGERLGVRAQGLAFGVEPELASIVVGERPHRYIPASELDAWLLASAERPVVDLLQGQFAPRHDGPVLRWKRLAILAAIVVISPLGLLLGQITKDGLEARAIEGRNKAVAVQLVPQAARYGDPARFAIGRLQASRRQGFGALAAGYLDAVRSVSGMRLDTLVYGQDGAIRSSVSYANYSDMDQLREALKVGGFDVVEQGTVTEGQRVTSDLIVRSKP
ncbi:type II secretion system protein GspL [Caulobacter endophyticus]|nr:type II secretion system protein GspL [Caulobacter endophyticus]